MNVTSVAVFGLSLDTLSTMYISCVVFYYLLLDTNGSGAKIGLAISQALSLTGIVAWGEIFFLLNKPIIFIEWFFPLH